MVRPLTFLSVEGFLDPVPTAPGYRLSGLGHSFAPGLQLDRYAGHRTLFQGDYTGRFDASRGLILPENLAARRAVLRPG